MIEIPTDVQIVRSRQHRTNIWIYRAYCLRCGEFVFTSKVGRPTYTEWQSKPRAVSAASDHADAHLRADARHDAWMGRQGYETVETVSSDFTLADFPND